VELPKIPKRVGVDAEKPKSRLCFVIKIMKKLFVIIAVVIACVSTSKAQDVQGKWTLDMNFNPSAIFDASASDMFKMPGIKARYFKSEDVAYRIGFNYSLDSCRKTYTGTSSDEFYKNRVSTFSIAPGIEKHFKEGKFSVYLGAELPISFNSTKDEWSYINIYDDVVDVESTGGYFGLGLHAVIGFDYDIFQRLYIGAEFTPGLNYRKYKDSKFDGDVVSKGGTSTTFGLSSTSGLRIGFRF
jgi:hypothetical protein